MSTELLGLNGCSLTVDEGDVVLSVEHGQVCLSPGDCERLATVMRSLAVRIPDERALLFRPAETSLRDEVKFFLKPTSR